jgi:hypothetical protein
MQPELRHCSPEASLCLRRCPVTPVFPLKVSNLPAPLFPCVLPWSSRDCSLELIRAAVSPPRRGLRPLVSPCRLCAHGRVRRTTLSAPKLFPSLWSPVVASPLISGEFSPRDRAAPPHWCPTPAVRSRASVRDRVV